MAKFDIFSGTQDLAVWLEAVEGLKDALARMRQRAHTDPGRYFLFDAQSQTEVASIDTTTEPTPNS